MLAYYWELFDRYDDKALDEVRDALLARLRRLQEAGHAREADHVERLWLGASVVKYSRQEHRDHVLSGRRHDDGELHNQLTIDDALAD